MAFSLNKATLIGNLGRDPETRFATTNNLAITTFSIATTNSYKGKDGNWVNDTTWHNLVAYNLSDYFKESLKKGSKVYVEGRIQNRDYLDKEGKKRYVSEIIVDKIIPLDARGGGDRGESDTETKSYDNNVPSTPNTEDDLPF